jgi:Flp pilus assembly pilin Flp
MEKLRRVMKRLRSLHRDEQGADMVEYILIIAAIALPLMAVAIIFRDKLWGTVKRFWNDITGNIEVPDQ